MADYLCPNSILNLEEQWLLFQIISETNSIPANVGGTEPCPLNCGEHFENHHILIYKNMNKPSSETYELLLNGNLIEMKKALLAWTENMKTIKSQIALDSMFY